MHVETWRDSYRGIFPDRTLEELSDIRLAAEWAATVTAKEAWPAVLVAVEPLPRPKGRKRHPSEPNERVLGFTCIGPVRDGEPDQGEIYTLYVEPAAQGRGIGRALAAAGLLALHARGHRKARVWVLTENPRAIAFYRRLGASPAAQQTFHVDGRRVSETALDWADVTTSPGAP